MEQKSEVRLMPDRDKIRSAEEVYRKALAESKAKPHSADATAKLIKAKKKRDLAIATYGY